MKVKVDFPGLALSKLIFALSCTVSVSPTLIQEREGVAPSGFFTMQERTASSPTRCAVSTGFTAIPISGGEGRDERKNWKWRGMFPREE